MLKCHEEWLLESGNFNIKRRILMENYENCCTSEKFVVFFMITVQILLRISYMTFSSHIVHHAN